jgi:hypothetical protein
MEHVIRKIRTLPATSKLVRVAAYARISKGKDAMLHSLSQQVSYYSSLIQNRRGWVFAGIYADEAKICTIYYFKETLSFLMITKKRK